LYFKDNEGPHPFLRTWAEGLDAGLIYGVFVVVLLWLLMRETGSLKDGKKISWWD